MSDKDKTKEEELPDELPRKKWWLPWLIGLVLIGLGIYGGRKIYGRVEPERLNRRAQAMIEKGDYRGAMITLSRALQINNNSRGATRTMAELMTKLEFPQAVEWRRRLVELSPGSTEEAMDLATFALQKGKPEIASQAIEKLPEATRQTAEVQGASGLAAIQMGKVNAAREFFAEAVRLNPKDNLLKYNLALVQVSSKEPAERAAGRDALVALSKSGRTQSFALRTLVVESTSQRKFDDALGFNTTLVGLPEAQFKDLVCQVELLRYLKKPGADAAMDRAKAYAEERPADAAAMVNWLRMTGKPEEGLAWAAKLDPAVTDSPLVLVARAECMTELKQWEPLQRLTKHGDWLGLEFRRWGFLARAQYELGDKQAFTGSWTKAITLCQGERGRLVIIAASAAKWGWTPQAREALWTAAYAPSPGWALQILYRSYAVEQNTGEMLRVARRMVSVNPDDLGAKNNVALFAALMGDDLEQSLAYARELVKAKPGNPVFESTYAFSLLANGMPEESLAVIKALPESVQSDAAYAPYFAFAYQANGDAAKAREFLARIDRKKLLPEEVALVARLEELLKTP